MACRYITFEPFSGFGLKPQVIKLDCWAARISVQSLTKPGDLLINGADAWHMFAFGANNMVMIEFPGLCDAFGLPINYNMDLQFKRASAISGGVTKIYYDPSKPDPDKQVEAMRAANWQELLRSIQR